MWNQNQSPSGVLQNRKQLCEGLFFHKATCLRPATFLKKRLRHKCFPVNIVKFFRTASLIGNLRSLLF